MKKRKRLIWQIFPSFLLITLLSLLAVSWYASNAMRHFFLEQTADDLNVRAILLEKQVIAHIAPLDPPTVDSICKAIGGQSATRFTIILPSGKVIGDSQETPRLMDNHAKRPEIAKALSGDTGSSIRYSDTLLQHMMYVARPLKKNGTIQAVIRASIPITSIDQELRSIQLKIAHRRLPDCHVCHRYQLVDFPPHYTSYRSYEKKCRSLRQRQIQSSVNCT